MFGLPSLRDSLALATDSIVGQQHTDAYDSSTFTITHQSLFHIISNHCWFICFNLCLILSWEDSLYGYRLSWLTTSHLCIYNLTWNNYEKEKNLTNGQMNFTVVARWCHIRKQYLMVLTISLQILVRCWPKKLNIVIIQFSLILWVIVYTILCPIWYQYAFS